jgi:hypothetical protein
MWGRSYRLLSGISQLLYVEDWCTVPAKDASGWAAAIDWIRTSIQEAGDPLRKCLDFDASPKKVLIATPEYNHSVPGVLKNALDWASRPVFESCFKNKPVSIISSSKAFTGGVRAQYQQRESLISMHAHLVMGPEVVVGAVHAKLAEDVYQDENVLTFMLHSLDRLRKEILSRRLVYA